MCMSVPYTIKVLDSEEWMVRRDIGNSFSHQQENLPSIKYKSQVSGKGTGVKASHLDQIMS